MPPLQAPKISFLEIYHYSKTHIKTNDMGLIAFCLDLIIPKVELYSKRNDNIDFATIISFSPGINGITLSGLTEIANITVPETGTYVILGIGAVSGGEGDFVTWELYRNNNVISQTYTDTGMRPHTSLIVSVSLLKNDIISLRCAFDGAKTLTRPNGILLLRIN